MLRRSIILLIFLALVILWAPAPAVFAKAGSCCYTEMDLSGVWKSVRDEVRHDGSFVLREFRFTSKECSLSYTWYRDLDMKEPLFTFTAEGSYTVNEQSPAVKGAYHASFRITRRSLTLRAADPLEISRLGFSRCGMKKDIAVDISERGCSSFRSVEAYPVEYDLVKRDGDTLSFGRRPPDGDCSADNKRPAELGPPLTRTDGR